MPWSTSSSTPPRASAARVSRPGVRWRLRSSLTHLGVRSLRSSDAAFAWTVLARRCVEDTAALSADAGVGSGERHHAIADGTARSLDRDLVAGSRAQECTAHGRGDR